VEIAGAGLRDKKFEAELRRLHGYAVVNLWSAQGEAAQSRSAR